jgi:hypothetical protein
VISTRYRSEPKAILTSPAPHWALLHVADLLLPTSLALWVLGIRRTNAATLGPFGLPAVLPPVFYAGVALLVVSAGTELARRHPSRLRMSTHLVALVVMLYGTAPLVYSEGRYAWLYKTIGVVQYVNANGQLNRRLDIYQNWPGFFALAAWFGKVAGVATPLDYAKWAQLVFELAALPILYLIYDALSLTVRQRWLALLLYSGSNWIGQDYFSPQALGTLLSLGIMAITIRWLYVTNPPRKRRTDQDRGAADSDQSSPRPGTRAGPRIVMSCTILLLYFVLTFTHELSPYMLAVQLGALVVARALRPRWLPFALAAIAVGYLLPRFAFVNSHYGLLNSIGNFFSNAAPPSFKAGAVPRSQLLIQRSAEALSVIMWGLAIAGAWLRRRSGRTALGLVLLAFSPVILLAIQAYGEEGLLRVYLFSLPWTAALAASALVAKPGGSHRAEHRSGIFFTRRKLAQGAIRAPLALGLILALFFPAFFGDDRFNMMPEAEVAVITSFFQTAPPGPVYSAINNAPLADTATYDLYPLRPIFGSYSLVGTAAIGADVANVIAANAPTYTDGNEPAYVLVSSSMIAYNQAYRVTSPGSFPILLSSLAHSSAWKLVVDQAGTVIYELPPPEAQVGLYKEPGKFLELKTPLPFPPLLSTASAGRKARPAHQRAHHRRKRRSTASPAPSAQP